MKLFLSYARVDKPYASQIIENVLESHDVWWDERLYVGQQWWQNILENLEWCEGFVYLLSPESIASMYCLREYQIISEMKKPVIPVLIYPDVILPEELSKIQYIDMSNGLIDANIKELQKSISLIESKQQDDHSQSKPNVSRTNSSILGKIINKVDHFLERENYDQAVFILSQAKLRGFQSRSLQQLLETTEKLLERQSYERKADREYRPIAEMIDKDATRHVGLEAFRAFTLTFPDYDPQNLAQVLRKHVSTAQAQRQLQGSELNHVFISYSREDTHFMNRLSNDLESRELLIWTDSQLEPGSPDWEENIQNAIRNARCVVVVLSPDAANSRWVNREIAYAELNRIRIFPLLFRGDDNTSVPLRLINHQRVDARYDYTTVLEDLIPALTKYIDTFNDKRV